MKVYIVFYYNSDDEKCVDEVFDSEEAAYKYLLNKEGLADNKKNRWRNSCLINDYDVRESSLKQ